MNRLTERFSNGQAAVYGCGENCKYDFKYCKTYNEDCPTMIELYEKLAAYEDAEEQGLLFRLPFVVGDIVYWVADAIYPFEVKDIRIDAFGFNVRFAYCGTDENKRYWEIVNSISVVGEKVFLTKEEAEAALERMEGC